MVCGPAAYHDLGRQPIAVAQHLGNEYPLVQPSVDIRYLVADFYLNYEDPADYDADEDAFVGPFHIAWLYGIGCNENGAQPGMPTPANAADILIRDVADQDVFDSTVADYATKVWSDRLTIHEWTSDTAVCRLVVHTKWMPDDLTPVDYDEHLVPDSAVLEAGVVIRQPRRVRKFILNAQELTGEIDIVNGYNIELINQGRLSEPTGFDAFSNLPSDSTGGGRAGWRVEVDGTPGGGRGRFPGCGDVELVIRSFNGQPANAYGDFLYQAEACYWFERPAVIVEDTGKWAQRHGFIIQTQHRTMEFEPNTLQFHNDCIPCCECQDYVEVKRAIDELFAKWQLIARDAETDRDIYADNRLRWLEQKRCRESQPQHLLLASRCDGLAGIGYSFCNFNNACTGPLIATISWEFHSYTSAGPVESDLDVHLVPLSTKKNAVSSKALRPYAMERVNDTTYRAYWDSLDSYQAARLQFLLKACDVTDGDSVTVTATATFAGQDYPELSETITLIDECVDYDPCDTSSDIA